MWLTNPSLSSYVVIEFTCTGKLANRSLRGAIAGGRGQHKNPSSTTRGPSSSSSTAGAASSNPFFAAISKKEDPPPSSTASYAAVVSGRGIDKQGHRDTSTLPGSANVNLAKDPQHNAESKNPFFVSQSNLAPSHMQGSPASKVGVVSQVPIGPASGMPPPYDSGVRPPPPYGNEGEARPKNPFLAHKSSTSHHNPRPVAPGNPRPVAPGNPRPVAPGNPFPALKQTSHPSGHQKSVLQHSGPSSLASTGRSLHLKGVPPPVNNREFMLEHFGKFGEVEVINCNIKKMCTNVTFRTHVSWNERPETRAEIFEYVIWINYEYHMYCGPG